MGNYFVIISCFFLLAKSSVSLFSQTNRGGAVSVVGSPGVGKGVNDGLWLICIGRNNCGDPVSQIGGAWTVQC